MIRLIDIIMITIDLALIMYFFNYATTTTDMLTRLIGCAAITMEVFFIRRQIKMIKNYKN